MGKKQIYNPYLPLTEYIPDGEPHLYDGRVYIYGSHDLAGGERYCMGDYVSYSAPEDDLKDWRYDGLRYDKFSDPDNQKDGEEMDLWAPDCVKGPDGRYYLYYCYNFSNHIGVAVCDNPAGPFSYLGHVHFQDGTEEFPLMPFDPAAFVDDDDRVYLYSGFGDRPGMHLPDRASLMEQGVPESEIEQILQMAARVSNSPGVYCYELDADMMTIKKEFGVLAPDYRHSAGSGFEGHAYFEAPSMRKVGDRYYFVYSSENSHELCYATADHPYDRLTYGGILVSIGDIGYRGNQDPVAILGNTHGGLVEVKGQWYVFYHRQTDGTEYSRQGCAEPVTIREDGIIDQVEITSCGLNGGPLEGKGTYPAAIACHLTSRGLPKEINYSAMDCMNLAMVTQKERDDSSDSEVFITNINDQTMIGYKYFEIKNLTGIRLLMRGQGSGTLRLYSSREADHCFGQTEIALDTQQWQEIFLQVTDYPSGRQPLYLRYTGEGSVELLEITLL